ncbi:MAG TPA: histidine kinase, partial [Bryobacteraceae bacterium]|nr:histidine kinase [Bryobacteraceae bacterium]
MRDLKTQFVSALLFILTVAAVCCAIVNFRQQSMYRLPDDGVIWVDRPDASGQNSVVALYVTPGSGADNAGIHKDDVLLQIGDAAIHKVIDVPQALQHVVTWDKARLYMVR